MDLCSKGTFGGDVNLPVSLNAPLLSIYPPYRSNFAGGSSVTVFGVPTNPSFGGHFISSSGVTHFGSTPSSSAFFSCSSVGLGGGVSFFFFVLVVVFGLGGAGAAMGWRLAFVRRFSFPAPRVKFSTQLRFYFTCIMRVRAKLARILPIWSDIPRASRTFTRDFRKVFIKIWICFYYPIANIIF